MRLAITIAVFTAAAVLPQDRPAQTQQTKLGHSLHGDSYDTGPRQKPWIMQGVGTAHFPISCKAETQQWFDQGNALLHSFWDYEAERNFRWVIKLDPDCAMGYWGLARVTDHNNDKDRRTAALREAARLKPRASDLERMLIDAWIEHYSEDPTENLTEEQRNKRFIKRLDEISWKYPDNLEVLSLYALSNLWTDNRLGTHALLQKIIDKDPRHPGANHYRIHEWIGPEADRALDASFLYGDIAPGIGHAQHMPGHIFSNVGMWREAAISMDKATRVEAGYMRDRMVFPFNTWNWAHNRNYLSYIQEQLGMYDAAITGARQLMAVPFDPKYNPEKRHNRQGTIALLRAQIRYERWKDILDDNNIEWGDELIDKILKAHAQGLAHIGLGQIPEAEKDIRTHQGFKPELEKSDTKWYMTSYDVQAAELRAKLLLAKGDTLRGLAALADAADKEYKLREEDNDPPFYANILYDSLGYEYLKNRSPALATTAFEKTLTIVHNDAFALAGLAQAYKATGEMDKAADAYGRLLYVWASADKGLKWMEIAKALNFGDVKPKDASPRSQREYDSASLAKYGPLLWQPYKAPVLDAVDVKGKHVSLADYKGKNVLLIFYLGDECPHCLQQLIDIGKRSADFQRHDTEILAVSSNSPQHNAESLKVGEVKFRLLSDEKLENAKRFKSYDDFEDIALHSTILIDKEGRVRWARNGGDPFTDFDFLLKEIQRSDTALAKSKS
jgi:peroxiredoxin/cytochrome c-type biogenesis protein CcmH/NrfG